jgi:ribosomal protein L37AE/L43A
MSNDIKCKECSSSQVYFRIKTKDWHCFKCGANTSKGDLWQEK